MKFKKILPFIIALLLIGAIGFSIYWLLSSMWNQFKSFDEKLAIALLTAATTILVSTITVMLGRYYERKKEIEASFREKKIKVYDDFLKEFFNLFHTIQDKDDHDTETTDQQTDNMVSFLREWQRKMILWGGQDVLRCYIDWMDRLKSGHQDAKTMWMTEDFFRAIRKDLGHSSWRLTKGSFLHLMLRNANLFIHASKDRPDLTLEELAIMEAEMEKNR